MGDQHTAPAEAYAPDPDRVNPDSPDLMPAWAAHLIALLILFLLEHSQTVRRRRARRLTSMSVARPVQAQDSAQVPAGAIGSVSDDATTRTRRGRNAAPEHGELPLVLKALLARLKLCDGGSSLLSQLEALGIVPCLLDPDTVADPATPVVAPLCVAKIRRASREFASAPQHAVSPAPWRQLARPGTGPPTGPPAVSRCQFSHA